MTEPTQNDIQAYFHCSKCMPDRPSDISPSDWSRIEVGWTAKGFQVRCIRCNLNIINLDFKGQKVDAI